VLPGTVETKRKTAPARLLTPATVALTITFGTGPDGLEALVVEIARLAPVEQFVLCVNRWIWL
jgi:hypothetical protein